MARRCTTASPPHSSKIARSPSRSVNVSTLTSAFLNAAVGQLYGQFDEDQIRRLLKVEDRESDDVALLKRVVDTAKQYFQDPQRFEQAAQEALGDEGDNA